jgi:hypothetical protein
MYSKLLQGETISKARFCLETECHSRSFDRDIEDIRLFLSESYNTSELIYDRRKGGYFLTETVQQGRMTGHYIWIALMCCDENKIYFLLELGLYDRDISLKEYNISTGEIIERAYLKRKSLNFCDRNARYRKAFSHFHRGTSGEMFLENHYLYICDTAYNPTDFMLDDYDLWRFSLDDWKPERLEKNGDEYIFVPVEIKA